MSDHKFEHKSGYPTFWNHIIDAVDFKSDNLTRPNYGNAFEDPTLKNKKPVQSILCSNCDSNLGFVYEDGPAPFFKRFQINSASLVFKAKPWFKLPEFTLQQRTEMRKLREKSAAGQKAYRVLLKEERDFRLPKYESRVKRDNMLANRAEKEK